MASTTDLITGVRDGTARPVATTVTATRSVAGTTLTVGALTGWDTTTKMHFQTYQKDASGTKIDSTATDWSGIVSGTTITNLTLTGGTDNGNAIGDTVEAMPTAAWADELALGILVGHNPNGTHKSLAESNIVPTAAIQDNAVTTGKIADNSITAAKLSTSAISLGYAQITSSFSTSSASSVQVTGLSASVTIPAGGRKIRITVWTPSVSNSSVAYGLLSIWDGTVGSGTNLAYSRTWSADAGRGWQASAVAIVTPSAGAKTYNVGLNTEGGGTATLEAAATAPAFILVEAI